MERLPLTPPRQNHSYSQLLQLACQGHAEAIAALMNRNLKPQQITAKVAWEETCLHISLEAAQVHPPDPLIAAIRKTVQRIQVKTFCSLKVSFWQSGVQQCAWSQQWAIPQTPQPQSDGSSLLRDRSQHMPANPISIADWLNQTAQTELFQHLHPLTVAGSEEPESRFLRFAFSPTEMALLPLQNIRQIVTVQAQNILPVPAMPEAVIGIYNFRGEMLWLVDLGSQFGIHSQTTTEDFSPSHPSFPSTYSIPERSSQRQGGVMIVIQDQGKSLGLRVPKVIDIENHQLNQLKPPGSDLFPPGLLPFVQGYLVRSSSPVLDVSALISDRRLQAHIG